MKIYITEMSAMITKHRIYCGRLITSFALRQLGDPECTGTSYSVYIDDEHLKSGEEPLSAQECLRTLSDAKTFVDKLPFICPTQLRRIIARGCEETQFEPSTGTVVRRA